MWYKILIILVLAGGIWVMARDERPGDDTPAPEKDVIREAYRIALQDLNLDTGASTIVHAKSAVEKTDHTVHLTDFTIDRAGRMHLSGARAQYDRGRSQLNMEGDIVIQTPDGMQGNLHSLTWDRASHRAWTDAPVRIVTKDGIIEAQRAQSFDDLAHLSLIGGVHAKIAGDSLGSQLADPFSPSGS